MSNRIDPNAGQQPPVPPQPVSMDDLCNRAFNSWQFKRKDEAIRYIIAGMRLMSQGIAKILQDLNKMKNTLDAMNPQQENKKQDEPPTQQPVQDP